MCVCDELKVVLYYQPYQLMPLMVIIMFVYAICLPVYACTYSLSMYHNTVWVGEGGEGATVGTMEVDLPVFSEQIRMYLV